MEQRVETVLTAKSFWGIRGILPASGGMQPDGTFGPVLRQHDGALPRFDRRRKGGQRRQAFGRSGGSFSTKSHLKIDLGGNPLDFHLTGGEVSDSTQFETQLDIGPDISPRIAITDKRCDSQDNRTAPLARGIAPVIPRHENSSGDGASFRNASTSPVRASNTRSAGSSASNAFPRAARRPTSVAQPLSICVRPDAGQIRRHGLGRNGETAHSRTEKHRAKPYVRGGYSHQKSERQK